MHFSIVVCQMKVLRYTSWPYPLNFNIIMELLRSFRPAALFEAYLLIRITNQVDQRTRYAYVFYVHMVC